MERGLSYCVKLTCLFFFILNYLWCTWLNGYRCLASSLKAAGLSPSVVTRCYVLTECTLSALSKYTQLEGVPAYAGVNLQWTGVKDSYPLSTTKTRGKHRLYAPQGLEKNLT